MPLLHLPTKAAGNYGFCPHILSICSQFSYAVEHALKARLATEYSYILYVLISSTVMSYQYIEELP